MTIVFVGAPGMSTTIVGRRLAHKLGLPFVDVDAAIEQQAGKPVTEIVADLAVNRRPS